ncbi:MAG: DUF4123 domain-containing protein [Paracoccus sp. (in: a-proteobacteria)]|nr:DUF4123 domain-containing protein [Paracoccus sp. (in: a-proteobacteria)]
MHSGQDNSDFWAQLADCTAISRASFLTERIIAGVRPLDIQFGHFPVLDVPPQLYADFLEPADTGCFAVVDGAQLPNLAERLAAARLNHCSLLSGKAARDYGATGPWLVQLRSGNRFTRLLFTEREEGSARQGYWNENCRRARANFTRER